MRLSTSLVLLFLSSSLIAISIVQGEYPSLPYSAIWSAPTSICYGSSLRVDQFDIIQNLNDSLHGGNLTLFEGGIGKFPYFERGDSSIFSYNGGIPQLGNLTYHLEHVIGAIDSLIPDHNFSGLAVIDFEIWGPYFDHINDGLYQEQSIEYVRKRHPDWNATQLKDQAAKEFNEAARSFFESTIKLAQKQRPKARWGYFGYPSCYGTKCSEEVMKENDELQWLWDASSALYPRVYFGML